jgi:hypothetical protein
MLDLFAISLVLTVIILLAGCLLLLGQAVDHLNEILHTLRDSPPPEEDDDSPDPRGRGNSGKYIV